MKRSHAGSCLASILVGELLLIGYHYNWIPAAFDFGFLPLIPILVATTSIVLIGNTIYANLIGPEHAPQT